MIEWIVSSCVLILLVILLRFCFRGKIKLKVQYGLWLLVAFRLLLPVNFFDSSLGVVNRIPENLLEQDVFYEEKRNIQAAGSQKSEADSYKEAGSLAANSNKGNSQNIASSAPTRQQVLSAMQLGQEHGLILWHIWVCGIALSGMAFIIMNVQFQGKIRRTRKLFLCENSSLPVYTTNLVDTPCMFGILRPAVYIPAALTDSEQLPFVLCHENVHYAHRDHLWSLLRTICLCLHWYNPLVWLAAHLSKQDSELACDEASVERLGEDMRLDYGKAVLALSCRRYLPGSSMYLVTSMSGGKGQLKERLRMIAGKPKMALGTLLGLVLLAIAAFFVTFSVFLNLVFEG